MFRWELWQEKQKPKGRQRQERAFLGTGWRGCAAELGHRGPGQQDTDGTMGQVK